MKDKVGVESVIGIFHSSMDRASCRLHSHTLPSDAVRTNGIDQNQRAEDASTISGIWRSSSVQSAEDCEQGWRLRGQVREGHLVGNDGAVGRKHCGYSRWSLQNSRDHTVRAGSTLVSGHGGQHRRDTG